MVPTSLGHIPIGFRTECDPDRPSPESVCDANHRGSDAHGKAGIGAEQERQARPDVHTEAAQGDVEVGEAEHDTEGDVEVGEAAHRPEAHHLEAHGGEGATSGSS